LELFGYPGLQPAEEASLMVVIGEFEEIDVTSNIIDSAIRIRRNMRTKTPDAIIAATALEVGAVLVTRNVDDFKKIDGLQLVNPWVR
jgi:predicted nucleic acid-binding protein